MKRIAVYLLAVVFLLLAGCGSQKSEMDLAGSPAASQNAASTTAGQVKAKAPQGMDKAESGLARKVTREASLVMSVQDVKEVNAGIQKMLGEAGGYIKSSEIWQENGRTRGTMTLRVPDGRLDGFVSGLETLGKVERKNISGQDVTEEYYDATARGATLEKQEKRLLELLNKAGSVKEMLEIENELARVRGEIESIQARLKVLDNLVDYATVNIELKDPKTISATGTLKEPFGTRMKAAWLAGASGVVNLAEGLALLLVMLLPYTPVLALAGYAIYRVRKNRRSRGQ